MTISNTESELDGANRHQTSVGDISCLASCQVWEAGLWQIKQAPEGTLNVNTLRERFCNVVQTLSCREVDVCCIQDIRYRGGNCHTIKGMGTTYKLYWSGNNKGTAGVGVFVVEEWIEEDFAVQSLWQNHLSEAYSWPGCGYLSVSDRLHPFLQDHAQTSHRFESDPWQGSSPATSASCMRHEDWKSKHKHKFTPWFKVWKLEDPDMSNHFQKVFSLHGVTRITEILEYYRNTGIPVKNIGIPVKDTYLRHQYWL